MTEYIGLSPSQQAYAKKNLLYCEMSLLETIKRYRKYKELRKQSTSLRVLLKRTVNDLQDELKKLESFLPKTKRDKFSSIDIDTTLKNRQDLEYEINEIKRKITELSQ